MAHMRYLKDNYPIMYTNLLTSAKLKEHLHEVEQRARETEERLVRQMMEKEGVTEQLKAQDMMDWVRKVNNIRSRARESVYEDVIYNL